MPYEKNRKWYRLRGRVVEGLNAQALCFFAVVLLGFNILSPLQLLRSVLLSLTLPAFCVAVISFLS
jgi:hypothetical protein